jgi:hypothetical protein
MTNQGVNFRLPSGGQFSVAVDTPAFRDGKKRAGDVRRVRRSALRMRRAQEGQHHIKDLEVQ